jgi:hypothetical protein
LGGDIATLQGSRIAGNTASIMSLAPRVGRP